MAKKLTKREVWMLHYLLDFPIHRYIMCNTYGRLDGDEKADNHILISQGLSMFVLCEGAPRHEDTYKVSTATMPVHDYLAEIITDRMDEVIDFPVFKHLVGSEFDVYAERFFNVVLKHMPEIEEIVLKSVKK